MEIDSSKNPSAAACQIAALAWCGLKTESLIMDTELALQFARIIDHIDQNPKEWSDFKSKVGS